MYLYNEVKSNHFIYLKTLLQDILKHSKRSLCDCFRIMNKVIYFVFRWQSLSEFDQRYDWKNCWRRCQLDKGYFASVNVYFVRQGNWTSGIRIKTDGSFQPFRCLGKTQIVCRYWCRNRNTILWMRNVILKICKRCIPGLAVKWLLSCARNLECGSSIMPSEVKI